MEFLLLLAGACLGACGTLLWALDKVERVVESNRRTTLQIQTRHNRELRQAYRDRDDLEEQADNLLQTDADWWRKGAQ